MGEEKREEKFDEDKLFKLTMGREWMKVVEIYRNHPTAHTTLLTKSKETALHIAISSFHSKSPRANDDATSIEQMMAMMEENGMLLKVLDMENVRGDTLLHLAAAVGSDDICERVAKNYPSLMNPIIEGGETPLFGAMRKRNARGETPLFVAAHHGNLQAFLSLINTYATTTTTTTTDPQQTYDYEPLRRPRDGDTILHSAISGEYFSKFINLHPQFLYFLLINDFDELATIQFLSPILNFLAKTRSRVHPGEPCTLSVF